jgi:hypothetical protein
VTLMIAMIEKRLSPSGVASSYCSSPGST